MKMLLLGFLLSLFMVVAPNSAWALYEFNVDYGQLGYESVLGQGTYLTDFLVTSNDVELDYDKASYCVDLYNQITKGTFWGIFLPLSTVVPQTVSNTYYDAANLLNYYGQPYDWDHDVNEEKLQLSIWETLYETHSNTYSIASGDFYTGGTSVNFNIPVQDVTGYKILQFTDSEGNYIDKQRMIVKTSNPVPEPTSLLLFGTGMMALGGIARKKMKRTDK